MRKMFNEIKRYSLAVKDTNALKELLNQLGFKEGSWLNKYKGKNVMSKCIPIFEDIELHITFNIDTLEWDDFDDCLVLDDNFCQPYSPFYGDGEIDDDFKFLKKVIHNYNRIMDNFVEKGLLRLIIESLR